MGARVYPAKKLAFDRGRGRCLDAVRSLAGANGCSSFLHALAGQIGAAELSAEFWPRPTRPEFKQRPNFIYRNVSLTERNTFYSLCFNCNSFQYINFGYLTKIIKKIIKIYRTKLDIL